MLVFLDIDGVMVPAQSWKSPEIMEDGFPAFSQRAVRVLQQVVSNNATILLTSSHKGRFSTDEWRSIFKRRGINVHQLFTLPVNSLNVSRKEEIIDWVNGNNLIEPFVILDDDKSLNDLPNHLKDSLIQTSAYIGLTESHLPVIESILHKNLQLV